MRHIKITKGLDVPISGQPSKTVAQARPVTHVGLIGEDYPGMKPTMLVNPGDRVALGQPVFSDKKNEGVIFTAPGAGEIAAINRGAKRRFESLIIRLEGNDSIEFCPPGSEPGQFSPEELRGLLVKSGLWCALRTRPYGKIPAVATDPAALFITAIDTSPLGPDIKEIVSLERDDFILGLKTLTHLTGVPHYLCQHAEHPILAEELPGVTLVGFSGPHPAGLPSTHIHLLDPVREGKFAWHIGAQDVIAIGALLRTGHLKTDRIVALGGPVVQAPRHLRTRLGACISELCTDEIHADGTRILSGSPLDGRAVGEFHDCLGRYHQQISCIPEGTGRQFFGWLRPGSDRFSVTRAFLSAFAKPKLFPFDTAIWGGNRAIFPLGTYEQVMPLDIIPTYLLKSLASGNTEKAKEMGCLELVEEDLALCSYVCPGKNDFGPMLRETLTTIEYEG